METLLVLTNLPDLATANVLAAQLIERRLAACVNVLSPCQSVYRWQGKVEQAVEIPLAIKTTRPRYAEVESAIRELHPDEVPEIIAIPVTAGLPAYLQWIEQECAAPSEC